MIINSYSDFITELVEPSMRDKHKCYMCDNSFSVKNRLKNPITKETRYFCNMCALKIVNTLDRVSAIQKDSFYLIPTFIHFGKLPDDKPSEIAVYHAAKIGDEWHAMYPNISNANVHKTFSEMIQQQDVYLVSGQQIGTLDDGRILISRIRILKDLTGKVVYTNETE